MDVNQYPSERWVVSKVMEIFFEKSQLYWKIISIYFLLVVKCMNKQEQEHVSCNAQNQFRNFKFLLP